MLVLNILLTFYSIECSAGICTEDLMPGLHEIQNVNFK